MVSNERTGDKSIMFNKTQADLLIYVLGLAGGRAYDMKDALYIGEMRNKLRKQGLTRNEASKLLNVLSNVPDSTRSIPDQRKAIDILRNVKNGKKTDIQPSLQQYSQCQSGYEYVNGYYKSDSTYVKGHCRKKVR